MSDPGAQALFAAAVAAGSPYSAGDQFVINNAFVALRSSGWLGRLDRLCFPASGTQAQGLIDWVTLQPYSITANMSFAAYLGLTSDGTGFIDTNLSASGAVQYTLNSGMFGVAISSTRSVGANMCVMGTESTSASQTAIYPWYLDGNDYCGVNAVWVAGSPNALPVTGIYMANRPDAGHMNLYRGTTQINSQAIAAAGLETEHWLVANINSGGVPGAAISTDTIAGFWVAQGASGDADQAVLAGIISTFLSQIGVTAAPVVANVGGGFQHLGRHTRDELFPEEEEAVTEATTEVLPVKPPSRKMRKRLAVAKKQAVVVVPPVDDEEEEAMMIGLAA